MAVIRFENGFVGTYQVGGQTLHISKEAIRPYDMTYGAIAGCLWSNFLNLAKDMEIRSADVVVNGTKRETTPTTLEHVTILIRIDTNASDEKIQNTLDEAIRVCSMVQTVAMVAKIDYSFERK